MGIERSTRIVMHDAMLSICESLHTMTEWVKADSRCLNSKSVDSIRWACNMVLCDREVLYKSGVQDGLWRPTDL